MSLRPSVRAVNGCLPWSSITSLMRSYNAPKAWYGVGRPFAIGAGVCRPSKILQPLQPQGSFLLIVVRSDEKTARRAVALARNADKHGRSRYARPEPFFLKKGRNAAFRGFAGPVAPFPPAMAILIIRAYDSVLLNGHAILLKKFKLFTALLLGIHYSSLIRTLFYIPTA